VSGERAPTADGLAPELAETLDAVVARLIPSDEVGPGGREAGVVGYIERALAGDYVEHRQVYEWGLAALDEHASSAYASRFTQLAPADQDAALRDLEHGLDGNEERSSEFFDLVLRHTIEGMFGDPSWGGNTGRVGWELLGYGGPRFVWGELDQVIVDADGV
jgi:gluconate 2-dehydrogenase gamma chain